GAGAVVAPSRLQSAGSAPAVPEHFDVDGRETACRGLARPDVLGHSAHLGQRPASAPLSTDLSTDLTPSPDPARSTPLRLSRRTVVVLTTALLAPALPSVAAAPVTVVTPLVQAAQLAAGATTAALTDEQLVGVTWAAGRPQVRVRWRTAAGWTSFEAPEVDTESGEAQHGTEPLWRPRGALAVDVRVDGAAQGLRLVRVSDGTARTRLDWGTAKADAADARALLGGVRSRADWGADESLRRGSPSYASGVEAVVVHHTAGSNDYAQADVPRRIRADYAYHVQARGWEDLGYNLVVDRFGGIWEGRAGGIGRATIGSHAAGFNTGTLGVSLLGDMTRATPTPEAVRAFARVGAYAAATWGFDPRSTVTLTSRGGPRFASGTRVTLPRVLGHRDVGQTACPGALMDRLGDVRRFAAAMVGPAVQLTRVEVTGAPVRAPQPVVITGSLSRSAPWTAALRDSAGTVLARSSGDSSTARLSWNGLRPLPGTEAGDGLPALVPALPGRYTWAIAVDDGVHPPVRREQPLDVGLPFVPVGWP
ncbi:MAG: repeat protein, partial [Frankiales bacterium]|nr:repeat protein [Frankiales bacterium]